MFPLIYTNPTATIVFIAACLIWLAPEVVAMPRQLANVSRSSVTVMDRGSMRLLIGLQWVGLCLNFLFAWWFPWAAISWPRATLFLIGVMCMLLGIALRWLAIWTLGQYFTRDVAVAPDQRVVQSGPYRYVRHPAYSGTFLTMLGVGLAATNWASLAALLICTGLGHFRRVQIEEQALIETIGAPYIEYVKRTRRFIPLIF